MFYVSEYLLFIDSHRRHKKTGRPYDIFFPIHLFQPLKLFTKHTCAPTFKPPDHVGHRIFRRNYHYRVNMIHLYILFNNLHSGHLFQQLRPHSLQIRRKTRIQNTPSILWDPYYMVLRSICPVPRKSYLHPLHISQSIDGGKSRFHPRASAWNSKRGFRHKTAVYARLLS